MSDLDQDIAPIPRSREENQERAFIAASRRKDRSLDARLESANRASMLHRKRTGKAFHITKEIVEKEAMYEEVDERYQEKRIRMLQAQNMQIEEQFHRHLLAAFAARANSSGSAASSIASRRASLAPRQSVDGASSSRKMSLDLTNLRSPFPHAMDSGSLTSPAMTADGYVLSPSTTSFEGAQSYMPFESSESSPYPNMMTTSASSGPVPAYVNQTPTPAWNQPQMAPSWAMQQHVPTPNHTPTDSHSVHMWQQQMMQQAQMPTDTASTMHMRQFRDRLASAPEFPITHAIPQPPASHPHHPTASISGPSGHSRGHSQPSNHFHNLHLLTQGTHLSQTPMAVSSNSSPKIESLTAETQSTVDYCPTPNTPLSPTAVSAQPVKNEEGVMVSHEELDPDFNEFSQFALGLDGNSSLQDREPFGFEDFVTLDEFATVSC
ncbi:uncharacterized protein N7503_010748 [Penicillium pulvis]|uniref:uncharacterized protein n=1 Tax=Penicillium pulvis TaxID=1562058 RepID=UPI0025480746|nr:uncharacterized protein N7503_010748 [Penicillium pulvis]KAJ5785536.1 hypothetical protein N7503_010748 [Penicillium pulvis]